MFERELDEIKRRFAISDDAYQAIQKLFYTVSGYEKADTERATPLSSSDFVRANLIGALDDASAFKTQKLEPPDPSLFQK